MQIHTGRLIKNEKIGAAKNSDISLTMTFLANALQDHMQHGYWLEPSQTLLIQYSSNKLSKFSL